MFSSFYANENMCATSAFDNLLNTSGGPEGPHARGSFWADVNNPRYNKKWPSFAVFEHWIAEEQALYHVEFVKAYTNSGLRGSEQAYSCSSGSTGGARKYVAKQRRKVPSRKTGCPMSLKVKTYTDTETVLGHYEAYHNHATRVEAIKFFGGSPGVCHLQVTPYEGATKEGMLEATLGVDQVTQNRAGEPSNSGETVLPTISDPYLSKIDCGDVLYQIRHIATVTHSLGDVPPQLLDLVSHSLNSLEPYTTKSMPVAQWVPNLNYSPRNVFPLAKTDSEEDTDTFSARKNTRRTQENGKEYFGVALQTGYPLPGPSSSSAALQSIPTAYPLSSHLPFPPALHALCGHDDISDSHLVNSSTSWQQPNSINALATSSFDVPPPHLHHTNSWSSLQSQQSGNSLASSSRCPTSHVSDLQNHQPPLSQPIYHPCPSTTSLASNYTHEPIANNTLLSRPSRRIHHFRSRSSNSLRYRPYPDASFPIPQPRYVEPPGVTFLTQNIHPTDGAHWDQAQLSHDHSAVPTYGNKAVYNASLQPQPLRD